MPTKLSREPAGTEAERQRKEAIKLINGGQTEQAEANGRAWLMMKNTMMQVMPEQAAIIAKEIVTAWTEGLKPTDEDIDNRIDQATGEGQQTSGPSGRLTFTRIN